MKTSVVCTTLKRQLGFRRNTGNPSKCEPIFMKDKGKWNFTGALSHFVEDFSRLYAGITVRHFVGSDDCYRIRCLSKMPSRKPCFRNFLRHAACEIQNTTGKRLHRKTYALVERSTSARVDLYTRRTLYPSTIQPVVHSY